MNNKEEKDDTPLWKKAIIFAVIILPAMFIAFECSGQDKKSDWVEQTTIEIPYNAEIIEGVTKNGNPKYYIDIEDLTIYISENNYHKFINKEVVLEIVEWYNPKTGKYRYTTRQKKQSNIVKRLNLDELW